MNIFVYQEYESSKLFLQIYVFDALLVFVNCLILMLQFGQYAEVSTRYHWIFFYLLQMPLIFLVNFHFFYILTFSRNFLNVILQCLDLVVFIY